jgi:hypothetical protein
VVVELSQILDDGADLVPALAGFHEHGEDADVGCHVLAILSRLFGFVFDKRKGLLAEDAADVVKGHSLSYYIKVMNKIKTTFINQVQGNYKSKCFII